MDGTVSLVIAISGHRDLNSDHIQAYRDEIVKIFGELRERYPHTPLLLITGLAEGADRIAAHAAKAAKIPYVAVFPMSVELYREDFKARESLEDFEELRKGALRCIELPLVAGATVEKISQPGEARDLQYRAVGRYLVQYSQILIAVWDDRIGRTGGTGEVVMRKLGQDPNPGPSRIFRLSTTGAGPVYVLPAVRVSAAISKVPALKREIRYPVGSKAEDFNASYAQLDQYNADVAEARGDSTQKSRRKLFAGEEAIGLSEAMEWVATVYARADSLAIRFASLSLGIWQVIFALFGLSGVALAWLHTLEGGHEVLIAYYLCLGAAAGLIVWDNATRRRNRHEDYRALAEALRVQFFWMAAGLPDLASEQYLLKQAGEMVWIRDAISECGLYDGMAGPPPDARSDLAMRLRLARTWVEGQAHYFSARRDEHEGKKRALTWVARGFAAIGLIAPIVGEVKKPLEHESHAVAAVALWFAALTWNYIERRGFAQEAREYARMYDLFHRADQELQKFELEKNLTASVETIRELGREALAENGDWLAMHRERQLAPHHAVGG